MKEAKKILGIITLLVFFACLTPTSIPALDLGLVGLLTQKLGVTEEQAKAGAGAIFNMAKGKLGAQNFAKVADAVPEMDDLLKAVPGIGGLGGSVESKMPTLGGAVEETGGLSSLSGVFSGIGLQSDMVNKFVPVILSYAETKGGPAVKSILAGVLK